jgi:hypothetical protein
MERFMTGGSEALSQALAVADKMRPAVRLLEFSRHCPSRDAQTNR